MEILFPFLGKAIRFLREDAGLTQQDVAERSGIHFTEISRLEQGLVNPTHKTMRSLAKGLDVRCSQILSLEEVFEKRAGP